MAMNLYHRVYCRSRRWERGVRDELLPWALADVDLGDNVLEIGPGYGANLTVLIEATPRLTAVELDGPMARRLTERYGSRVQVLHADGTDTGLPPGEFSAVVCFTMLHHIPSVDAQDRLFAEAHRVLRPGGVFAGSDSRTSLRWRLIHLGDTCNPVPPETLPQRLSAAGFTDVHVDTTVRRLRWRAIKPG